MMIDHADHTKISSQNHLTTREACILMSSPTVCQLFVFPGVAILVFNFYLDDLSPSQHGRKHSWEKSSSVQRPKKPKKDGWVG